MSPILRGVYEFLTEKGYGPSLIENRTIEWEGHTVSIEPYLSLDWKGTTLTIDTDGDQLHIAYPAQRKEHTIHLAHPDSLEQIIDFLVFMPLPSTLCAC